MKKTKNDIFYESTLDTIIKDLKSKDRQKTLYAIESISAHASLSASTVPQLEKLAGGEDRPIARAATNALKKIALFAEA